MVEDREILNLVGARIKVLRKEKGLSQEALGEKGGFHFTYIGQVERGEKNISLVNLAKIAEALEVNITQLFPYENKEMKFMETDTLIQEIVSILKDMPIENILLSKNIIIEILKMHGDTNKI